MTGLHVAATLLVLTLPTLTLADAPKPLTAADKVKATVNATRPDGDGGQTITVTLEIEKGAWLYANPVRHNNEFLDANRTIVKILAKEKVTASVKYPPGLTRRDGGESYDIYEGTVTIHVQVLRARGDGSPLDIRIPVQGATDRGV
jgi:hypothetical protein